MKKRKFEVEAPRKLQSVARAKMQPLPKATGTVFSETYGTARFRFEVLKHFTFPAETCIITTPWRYEKPNLTEREDKEWNDTVEKIEECLKNGKTLIGIYFLLSDPSKRGAHANALIYDTVRHVVEIFEPNGENPYGEDFGDKMYAYIRQRFARFDPRAKVLEPEAWCPVLVRYQGGEPYSRDIFAPHESYKRTKGVWEPGGYCVAWSLFFVFNRLQNPQLTSQEVAASIERMYRTNKQKRQALDQFLKAIQEFEEKKISAGLIKEKDCKSVVFRPYGLRPLVGQTSRGDWNNLLLEFAQRLKQERKKGTTPEEQLEKMKPVILLGKIDQIMSRLESLPIPEQRESPKPIKFFFGQDEERQISPAYEYLVALTAVTIEDLELARSKTRKWQMPKLSAILDQFIIQLGDLLKCLAGSRSSKKLRHYAGT